MATAFFLYICPAKVIATSAKFRAGDDCCFMIQRESENWVTSCSPEFAFRAVWLQMVAMCRMDFICYGLNICVLLCCERPIFLLVQCLCSLSFLHCKIPPFLSSVSGAVVKGGLGQAHKSRVRCRLPVRQAVAQGIWLFCLCAPFVLIHRFMERICRHLWVSPIMLLPSVFPLTQSSGLVYEGVTKMALVSRHYADAV